MTGDTRIHTILQCFVDLNLETNENSKFSLDLLDVSFAQSTYTINEGQVIEVDVSLSQPSIKGWEEVEVGIVANAKKSMTDNTSLSDFDVLGETYPKTLLFSAGQQTHTLKFLANNDFFEENAESFDVILGFFTNVNPGQYITSTVNIVDQTNLKEVFINEQGGNYQISTITNASTLTFSALEGTSKQIKVSLDSPSVFGIEQATLQFTNNTTSSNDYSIVGSSILSWAIGEKDKTFTIQTTDDNLIEDIETLEIEIVGANFVNINNPNRAEFKIFDNSPEARFINVNFQGLYTQIGGTSLQNIAQLAYILDGEEDPYNSNADIMFLKFGEKFISTQVGNNVPGSNAIRNSTNTTDTIFFGQNPDTGEYGDVRLKVINQGTHSVIIDGNQINPSQSISFDIDAFDYNITLPANDTLVPAGTIIAGDTLSTDTLSEAFYEFIIESDYAERSAVIQDIGNNDVINKEIHLGSHRFEETYSLANATASTNQHNLVTTYNQIYANWYNYPNYNSPKTCLPLTYYTQSPFGSFPSNAPDAISVENGYGHARIDGLSLLSDNSIQYGSSGIGNGPSAYNESTYVGVEFLPSGQTIGITCSSIFYPGTQTKRAWTSIPFEIIP